MYYYQVLKISKHHEMDGNERNIMFPSQLLELS